MEKNINNISFEAHDLPVGLYERVLRNIDREKIRETKRSLLISRIGMMLSVVAFIPAIMYLYNNLYQTGFIQFFTLVFHSGNLVARYWQDFGSALLEMLPITSLVFFIGTLFVFLISLRSFIVNSYYQLRLHELHT